METVANPQMLETPAHPQQEMSVKDWFFTILIVSLPVVGFIMLFVWAFGNDLKTSRSNFAKASLLWMLVWFGFMMLLFMIFGAAGIFQAITGQEW
jgi:heme/copper-type cytochrome/quinol oxidase subunit 2